MKQLTLYCGIAGTLSTLGYVLYLCLSWPSVVLVDMGSRSEHLFRKRLADEGIAIHWDSALGTMEIHVRRLWAPRAARLAREMDPTGNKIVVTYPDYTRTEDGNMKFPRDKERP